MFLGRVTHKALAWNGQIVGQISLLNQAYSNGGDMCYLNWVLSSPGELITEQYHLPHCWAWFIQSFRAVCECGGCCYVCSTCVERCKTVCPHYTALLICRHHSALCSLTGVKLSNRSMRWIVNVCWFSGAFERLIGQVLEEFFYVVLHLKERLLITMACTPSLEQAPILPPNSIPPWSPRSTPCDTPVNSTVTAGNNSHPPLHLSHSSFHSRLKTYLFSNSFPP